MPSLDAAFEIVRAKPHGHVAAVLGALKSLGLERLLDRTPSQQRALTVAMIAARIIEPRSKLATARGFAGETANHTPRRGTRRRGRLGRRSLRSDGLAALPSAEDRTRTRQAASRERLPRPLRSDLGLPRRLEVQAGSARLLQGQEEGEATDRPRPALQPGRMPGGGRGLRGQHRRSRHPEQSAAQASRPLLAGSDRHRRRPRADHQRPHRGRPRTRGPGLDQRPCARLRSAPWPSRATCNCRSSTSATWRRSASRSCTPRNA